MGILNSPENIVGSPQNHSRISTAILHNCEPVLDFPILWRWFSSFSVTQRTFSISTASLERKVLTLHQLKLGASQVALVLKNLPASAGDVRDTGLISGSGRSPGRSHGNPCQYSCLGNPMDRGAWWVTVHRITKSWTRIQEDVHKRVCSLII